ncbi:hypothetical protein PLICRDRAFT_105759 [Plicaturopsis crispa FD-325 SS-3]|nr:hypothetical protein PLICRDRAFT_105759 [Plicaturopsis crispa FD-325 SS-3]
MSGLSITSNSSQNEDWDRSESDIRPDAPERTTPRNSVIFPAGDADQTPSLGEAGKGKRTLSELLRLHAEKGTDCNFSAEEASRVAEMLGQWINSGSSPYEAEDDFFSRSQDDSSLATKRGSSVGFDSSGRPRGQSESVVNSRPSSAADGVKT